MHLASRSIALALAATLVAACAPDDAATPEETEDDATALRPYDCRGSSDNGDTLVRLEVGISARTVRVTDLSKDAAAPDTGKVDASYAPTSSTYKGASRYVGFSKLADALADDVSTVEVMVSPELGKKAASGKIWIRTAGPEGGSTSSYQCSAKDKPLAPDTKRAARLFCSLDKLSCHAGAPPGDTCLSELFVGQGDGKASLKLTWLDHFGVRVTERKESIGDSSKLERDKASFAAKWTGWSLDVSYRAGVSYLGTLTMPSGEKAKVHCSDLAMFD